MNEILYKQNLSDLGYVISKMAEIIGQKEITDNEEKVLNFCEKVIKQVNEKQKEINKCI